VLPTATVAGFGVTVMVCNVGAAAVTVKFAVPLIPVNVAVIRNGPPAVTPVATPVFKPIVASEVLAEVQLACVVKFCVELSE
jgi:hypothetical protein